MKKVQKLALALTVVAVFSCVSMVHASSITTKVDFAFHVDGVEYPAGMYTIERTDQGLAVISGKGVPQRFKVWSTGDDHDDVSCAELIFEKMNGKVMLSQIRFPNSSALAVLTTSRQLVYKTASL